MHLLLQLTKLSSAFSLQEVKGIGHLGATRGKGEIRGLRAAMATALGEHTEIRQLVPHLCQAQTVGKEGSEVKGASESYLLGETLP